MLTVRAEEDLGTMSNLTRWKPQRVRCLHADGSDAGEHIVKFRQQGRLGVCALVSEVVAGGLLREARIPTVEPRLVEVTDAFAFQWNRRGVIPYRAMA